MAKTRSVGAGESAAEWVRLGELVPWDKNPRLNEAAVPKVAESIRRFGFGAPLVGQRSTRLVLAGHTRLAAAKRLGLATVPVRWLDLSDAEARAYALADNKIGEEAEWDDRLLAQVTRELAQDPAVGPEGLGVAGFDKLDLRRLDGLLHAGDRQDVDEDTFPEIPKHPTSRPGDVYELGPHRLLCGDATQPEQVREALGGQVADLLWTDPPYGVKYRSGMSTDPASGKAATHARFEVIENDDLDPAALRAFLSAALSAASSGMREGAAFYVCHANQKPGIYPAFEGALLDVGFHVAAVIAWIKECATMGWQDYRSGYEPILYGWKPGADRRKVEDRTETNVWQVKRVAAVNYVHPTQKPVELVRRAMRNSTVGDDVVLDPFGGSGTTLIAAAYLGRRAVLLEKDPGFCDVIRERWLRFEARLRDQHGGGVIMVLAAREDVFTVWRAAA